MNEIKIFENAEFGKIRTVSINDEPYFMGNDIARALGYSNPSRSVKNHCKKIEKRWTTDSVGRQQEALFISESDLYRLIIKSNLPSAEKFESWVMEEVLPSIRKHGGYIAGQETMTDEELMAKALLVAQNKITERDAIIYRQQMQIEEAKPKTIFADAVSTSHTSILIGDLAKLICQNGVKIGQKRLFQWMRDNGYLMKQGSSYNMPKQKYMEQGLFEIKESSVQNPDGSVRITRTPKITGRGQVYFVNKFLTA